MNLGVLGDLTDVIKFGSFSIDRLLRLRGLGSARGREWPFPNEHLSITRDIHHPSVVGVCPVWWGYAIAADRGRLESILPPPVCLVLLPGRVG